MCIQAEIIKKSNSQSFSCFGEGVNGYYDEL